MNPYSPPGVSPDAYPVATQPPYPFAPPASSGAVSDAAVELLRKTRPWVLLLSVLSFVGGGLMILMALGAVAVATLSREAKPAAMLGVFYLPLALLYVYPALKLRSYGAAIARLTSSRAGVDLEDALGHQKSFWKYCGIASVVLIALYALGLAFLITVGAVEYFGLAKQS
jgi:hypothetical protein